MDFIAQVLDLAGVSTVVAVVTGASLGLYLAAIHNFVPVRNIRRSLITDFVIGLSFFVPLALMRIITSDATLAPVAWTAFTMLWLLFATTADTVNFLLCRWKQGRLRSKE